ncbi:MAG TPA: Gfo/Idh/MocA family oxidoreductase [Tepidisphaeraceae bacterium]|jgi:predicted dehydrogenase
MTSHRIVIIGIGAVAEAIAQSIETLPGAKLVAGSCRTREKGETFAAHHTCKWYSDADEMLRAEKPAVAIVATPSGAHLEAVQACARHGVHVLCEKPLEITTARIDRMIASAREAKIILGGIFPQRFNPVVRTIYDAARAGRFGSVSLISVAVPWWRDDAYYGGGRWQGTKALDGGGALMNQGSHSVDLLQWLAGATMPDLPAEANPVEEVFAFTARRGREPKLIEVEDTALAVVRFRNGAVGQILAATSMYPGAHRRLIIAGRDGLAELVEDTLQQFKFRSEQPQDEQIRQQFGQSTHHAGGSSNPMAFNFDNHKRNIAAFLEAVEQNRQPDLGAPEAGKAVRIIEACYESAETGKPVQLA